MLVRHLIRVLSLTALAGVLVSTSCGRKGGTEPADFSAEGAVYLDQFGSGVTYEAFLGSKLDAVDIDLTQFYSGSSSLNVIVPDSGDPSGSYAGGAFTHTIGRDLSGFDALTFWARANTAITLNVAGVGNDNTGASIYTAEMNNLPLTTTWTKFAIPIPLPEKLTTERGLFYFAEGPEDGAGSQIWFDEIQFETLGTVTSPAADLGSLLLSIEVGETVRLENVDVTLNVNGVPQALRAMPSYLTLSSSDTGVVSGGINGDITGVSEGTATVTARLGSVDASGSITVTVKPPDAVPTTAAPMPTVPAMDVVSMYSDAYTDAAVNSWSADWDDADVSDETVASDNVKKYSNLVFAGIEFNSPTINASGMTRFHMDIWTPNSTASPIQFKIKLVDFGADGIFGGGNDVEQELTFDENTAPALTTGTWVSIDLPLAAFSGLLTRGHLAQMIISGDLSTVYVDNIYFYDAGSNTAPTIPAPIPNKDPADVISLFSDVYADVAVDSWSAVWDLADVQDYLIGIDSTKKYTNLLLAGIELRTSPANVSAMTHFHMDVWTPDPTVSPSKFKVKLVDFGANGVYDPTGGDDVSHEIVFDQTTMLTGFWVSLDIRLSDFSGLTTKEHIGRLIISGDPDTVYVDNIYFYDSGIPTEPTAPAPTPSLPQTDVISLFSDAYANVPVDTWSTPWDTADVADFVLGSDSTKKYTNLLFAGIEFTSPTIDASAMTHFHMDVWTPDATNAPATFLIKLVDFGANGVWNDGGVDDVEHEITLDENTMNTSSWVTIEIPLTDFTNLTTRGHLAQLIISGDPNTIYVDNVYFHK